MVYLNETFRARVFERLLRKIMLDKLIFEHIQIIYIQKFINRVMRDMGGGGKSEKFSIVKRPESGHNRA